MRGKSFKVEYFIFFIFFMASLLVSIKEFFTIIVSSATVLATIIALVNIRYTKKAIEHSEKQFNLLVEDQKLKTEPDFYVKRQEYTIEVEDDIPFIKDKVFPCIKVVNIGNGFAKNVNISLVTNINEELVSKIKEGLRDSFLNGKFEINHGPYFTLVNEAIIANENNTIHEDFVLGINNENNIIEIKHLDIFMFYTMLATLISWDDTKKNEVRKFDYRGLMPSVSLRVEYIDVTGEEKSIVFVGEQEIRSHHIENEKLKSRVYLHFKKQS
jgi:hypothetical protein